MEIRLSSAAAPQTGEIISHGGASLVANETAHSTVGVLIDHDHNLN